MLSIIFPILIIPIEGVSQRIFGIDCQKRHRIKGKCSPFSFSLISKRRKPSTHSLKHNKISSLKYNISKAGHHNL